MENNKYTPIDNFTVNGHEIGITVLDFWKYAYSNLNSDPRDDIAKFLVSRALGLSEATNRQEWTLYDIDYKGVRIEVKSTGYYQTWRNNGNTREEVNPLILENWEFYVIPTTKINEECGDNQTIGLSKVRKLCGTKIEYSALKKEVMKYTGIKVYNSIWYCNNFRKRNGRGGRISMRIILDCMQAKFCEK